MPLLNTNGNDTYLFDVDSDNKDIFSFLSWSSVSPTKSLPGDLGDFPLLLLGLLFVTPGLLGDLGDLAPGLGLL